MHPFTIIPHSAQPRARWKNGAGWTTEIAARPAIDFDWRLSVAEVDHDCDFSAFPGIDRTILVISGPGMTLHVGDAAPVHLTAGGPAHAFPGDLPARCTVAGPTRDFNCMTRRGRSSHSVHTLDLAGSLTLPRTTTLTAIYILTGHATFITHPLHPGDCLLLEPVPSDSPTILTGTATLVRVQLTPTTS